MSAVEGNSCLEGVAMSELNFGNCEALKGVLRHLVATIVEEDGGKLDMSEICAWMKDLIESLHQIGVTDANTMGEGSPGPPDRAILTLMATLLLHPAFAPLRDRALEALGPYRLELGGAGKALEGVSRLYKVAKKGKVSGLKELYSNREIFKTFNNQDASGTLCRAQLVKCLLEPHFHGPDGQKFLGWCLGSIDALVVDEAVVLIESLNTCGTMPTLSEGTSLIESLSTIWHMAWKVASDPPIKFAIEHVVEKWTHLSLKSDKPLSTRYGLLLNAFHSDRDATTAELLCRTLPGLLHELLHAANWKVRQNAVVVFCRTFPLVDLSLPAREYELEMGRNLQCLLRFIHDPHPHVRAVAARSIPVLLFNCWEIVPSAIVTQLLCDLIEKLSRDMAAASVREATLQGLTTLIAHPLAQEALKAGLPHLNNCLHDSIAPVRLAMAKLLYACGHIPEYHFALVCPLPEIFRRLLCESVTVEIEEASTPHYDSMKSVSYQICETLANLLSASLYEKHSNVTSQVDKLLKVAQESPAVLSPLLRFSRKQAAPLDRLRLSAALFMTAHHHSGAAVQPDMLEVEGAVLGSVLNSVAAELLFSVPIKLSKDAKAAKPHRSKPKKKKASVEEPLPAEQLVSFFETKFPPNQFVPYVREGCMLALNRTATDLYGYSVMQVLRALLMIPGYVASKEITDALTRATMQCQAIGSEAWTQLLHLSDICNPEIVAQYINDVVNTLNEALSAIIDHLLGSESRLEPSDVDVALMFLSSLPKILEWGATDTVVFGHPSNRNLRVLNDVGLRGNIMNLCQSLIKHLIESPDSILPADQAYFSFWMEGVRLATTVLLHLGDSSTACGLQDSFQRLCNRLQSTDRFGEDVLARLLSSGSQILKTDSLDHLAARERHLYAAISDCLGAVSLFVTPLELDDEDGRALESLYGVRNLMLRWMLCLTASTGRRFYTHYLAFWDHTSRLLRSLMASRRESLVDFYATFTLFCCFSFVDANPWPPHWSFEPDGSLVIEACSEETGGEDDENLPPGKHRRLSGRPNVAGRREGGMVLSSVLNLPSSLCNRLHPRLGGLLNLIKYILKESQALETPANAAMLLEQVAQSFSGGEVKVGTMTLSSKWIQHVPPSIRTFICELIKGSIKTLLGGANATKSTIASPERTGIVTSNSAREGTGHSRRYSSLRTEGGKEETTEALEALLHSTGKTPSRAPRSTL